MGAAPTTCHPDAFGQQTIDYNGLTTTSRTLVYLESGTTSQAQTKAETRLATGKTHKVTDNTGKTITLLLRRGGQCPHDQQRCR